MKLFLLFAIVFVVLFSGCLKEMQDNNTALLNNNADCTFPPFVIKEIFAPRFNAAVGYGGVIFSSSDG